MVLKIKASDVQVFLTFLYPSHNPSNSKFHNKIVVLQYSGYSGKHLIRIFTRSRTKAISFCSFVLHFPSCLNFFAVLRELFPSLTAEQLVF